MTHKDKKGIAKLMTRGHLGGPKFVGFLTDFQIFGTALTEETLLGWTVCKQQTTGDLFSSTGLFDRISLQLQNIEYQLGVSARKWKDLCESDMGNKKILEVFQDNMDKELNRAGPIFCEPLNGKLIEFPHSLEKLQEINAFKML